MGDHIIRSMGAANLRVVSAAQPDRVAIVVEDLEGALIYRAPVTPDIGGTVAMEASGQHFDLASCAALWTQRRVHDLTSFAAA